MSTNCPTTPGGGLGDTPYFNSLRMSWEQSVSANTFYSHAVGYASTTSVPTAHGQADGLVIVDCLLFLEPSINSSNGSPRILAGLLRDRLHIYQWHHRFLAAEADRLCVYEFSGIEWFYLPHGTCFFFGESCLQWCIVSPTIAPIRMQIRTD